MAKIFISYSRASKDVIEELVKDLTDADQETWIDEHLTGGQKWWDKILSEIRECEIFVAALTPDFIESKACQREAKYAKDLQRIVLPIRLSDKVSPGSLLPDFSQLQWVDYRRLDKQAFKDLRQSIKYLPKAPPLPDPLPDPPAVPEAKKSIWSVLRIRANIIIGILNAGAAIYLFDFASQKSAFLGTGQTDRIGTGPVNPIGTGQIDRIEGSGGAWWF